MMPAKLSCAVLITAFAICALPLFARAGPNDGVFGCQGGTYPQSIGAQAATDGIYVPVADRTVEMNTGILVYKECVLRGVVDRKREAIISGTARKGIIQYLTGRDGQPIFSVNFVKEQTDRAINTFLRGLKDDNLTNLNTAFRDSVKSALGRSAYALTYGAARESSCSYQGDAKAMVKNKSNDVWTGIMMLTEPGCNPLGAYETKNDEIMGLVVADQDMMRNQLMWGNSNYPQEIVTKDEKGIVLDRKTVTPGYMLAGIMQQYVGAGFDMVKTADDIDKLNGQLLDQLETQILSENSGLAGLSQTTGGQPSSYLDQMTAQSKASFVDTVVGVGNSILDGQIALETNVLGIQKAVRGRIQTTMDALKAKEKQCYDLIAFDTRTPQAQHVCAAEPANNACSDTAGNRLTLPTTKRPFSDQLIASQGLADALTQANKDVDEATKGLQTLQQMKANLGNATTDAQKQAALAQLIALQNAGQLHKIGYDVQIRNRQADIYAILDNVVPNAQSLWTDPAKDKTVAWCNVQNPEVITAWDSCWKQGGACIYPR